MASSSSTAKSSNKPSTPLHGTYISEEETEKSPVKLPTTNSVERVVQKYHSCVVLITVIVFILGATWFFLLPVFLVLEDDHAPQATKLEETAFPSSKAMTYLTKDNVNRSIIRANAFYTDLSKHFHGDPEHVAAWIYHDLRRCQGLEVYNSSYVTPDVLHSKKEGDNRQTRYNVWGIVRATGRSRSDETILISTRFDELYNQEYSCSTYGASGDTQFSHKCITNPSSAFLLMEQALHFQYYANWLGKDVVFAFLGGDAYDDAKAPSSNTCEEHSEHKYRDVGGYLARDMIRLMEDLRLTSRPTDRQKSCTVGPVTAALFLNKPAGVLWNSYRVHTQGSAGRITEMDLYTITQKTFGQLHSTSTRIMPSTEFLDNNPSVLSQLRLNAFRFFIKIHLGFIYPTKLASYKIQQLLAWTGASAAFEGSFTADRLKSNTTDGLYCYESSDVPSMVGKGRFDLVFRLYPGFKQHGAHIQSFIKNEIKGALNLEENMIEACTSKNGEEQSALIRQMVTRTLQRYSGLYYNVFNLLTWIESFFTAIGGFLLGPEYAGGRIMDYNIDSVGLSIFQSNLSEALPTVVAEDRLLRLQSKHLDLLKSVEDWVRRVNILEERLHAASRQHILVSGNEFVPNKEILLQSVVLHLPLVLVMVLSLQNLYVILYSVLNVMTTGGLYLCFYYYLTHQGYSQNMLETFMQLAQDIRLLCLVQTIFVLVTSCLLKRVATNVANVRRRCDDDIRQQLCETLEHYNTINFKEDNIAPNRMTKILKSRKEASERWKSLSSISQSWCLLEQSQSSTLPSADLYRQRELYHVRLSCSLSASLVLFLCHIALLIGNYSMIAVNGLYLIPLCLFLFSRVGSYYSPPGLIKGFLRALVGVLCSGLGIIICLAAVSTFWPSGVRQVLHILTGYKTSLLSQVIPRNGMLFPWRRTFDFDSFVSSLGYEQSILLTDLLQFHNFTGSCGLVYACLVIGPLLNYHCLSWFV